MNVGRRLKLCVRRKVNARLRAFFVAVEHKHMPDYTRIKAIHEESTCHG